MKHIYIIWMTGLLLQVLCVSSEGQKDPPLSTGDRIRVTAPSFSSMKIVGEVLRIDADTLVVGTKQHIQFTGEVTHLLRLPVASLTKIEMYQGKKRNTIKGTAYGALIGAGIGAIIGYSSGDEVRASTLGFNALGDSPISYSPGLTKEQKAWQGAIVAGALGLTLGAITGAIMKSEIWTTISSDRVHIGFRQHHQEGLVLSASFAF